MRFSQYPGSVPGLTPLPEGSGKGCFENWSVSLLFPSGPEVHFVLVFTMYFVHRVFTSLKKVSFCPIIYRGGPPSAFSPLRVLFLRRPILIVKTQYFLNVAFSILFFVEERLYVFPIIYIGLLASFRSRFLRQKSEFTKTL